MDKTISAAFGDEAELTQISGGVRVQHDRMTMEMLASRLSQFVDWPVIDQTGLQGRYSMRLDLRIERPDGIPGGEGPGASDAEMSISISSALQALGLRLERRKVLYEVTIIDHVEKPTEN
jgi:uncharacterized protein (TIGR03435 family)